MSDNGKITWITETRKLGDLIPWEDNPRQLTEEQAERLERSLTKFGYSQLVEIEPDGTIVDGHQRDDLMKILPEFGPEAPIECRVSNRKLTLEERKEFIALKHQGATGEWNWEGMHNLYDFDELVDYGFDTDQLEAYGFMPDEEELTDDPGAQIDRAEELREQWGVETGQLWRLGEHRLIVGDCTDAEVVARVMDGEKVDCALTDPPYCSGGFQETGKASGSVGTRGDEMIVRDTLSTRGYQSLMRRFLDLTDAGVVYIFTDWRMWINLFDIVEEKGFGVRNMIVWDKGTPGMGAGWRMQHELIMCGIRVESPFDPKKAQGNVIQCERTGNVNHATEKPTELLETIIEVNDMADIYYDPFLGSGTTLIACERLNRKCRAIEISPAYVAVAIQRWVDMTSGEPELVNS